MFNFKLPDIGEGVAEGEIVKWLVKEGDRIANDQEMVEVMTDKVTVKIPSPASGTVSKIHFPEGKVVQVGEVLITIDDGKETAEQEPEPKPAPVAPPTVEYRVDEAREIEHRSISKVLASPAIRKLARDLGVDLTIVRGTGPNGRVLEDDIKRIARNKSNAASMPPPVEIRPDVRPPVAPSAAAMEGEVLEPKGLRRLIFEKMSKAKQIMPHFTVIESFDMTEIQKLRDDLKSQGTTLGFTPFFVRAVSVILKDFPKFNAIYNESGRNYVLKKNFNIGVAVDTPDGLTVVVIKDADKKDMQALGEEVASLAEKARKGSLDLGDVQNSTFTVSNVGSIGGIASTPIINYPEVAILGVHRMEKVAKPDGNFFDRMYVSMSCDHRIIDGADAARFISRLKELMEKPQALME